MKENTISIKTPYKTLNKRAQRALERSPETEGFLNSLFSLL